MINCRQQDKKSNISQIITDLQQLEDMDKQDIEYQKQLKQQVHKIEYLKQQYAKKDQELMKLEQQLGQYKVYYEKYENAKTLLESAVEQLEKSENQNKLLQNKLSQSQEQYAKLEQKHQGLLMSINNDMMEKEVNQLSQNSNLKFEMQELKQQYQQKFSFMEAKILQLKQQTIEKETQNSALIQQLAMIQKQLNQQKSQTKNMDVLLKNHLASTKQQMSSYPQSLCETENTKDEENQDLLIQQLAQDYDEAVKRIQQFERQLTEYRTENIELKKYIQYLTDQ